MCLYTQQTDAKKAKAPIICYKTARLVTELLADETLSAAYLGN